MGLTDEKSSKFQNNIALESLDPLPIKSYSAQLEMRSLKGVLAAMVVLLLRSFTFTRARRQQLGGAARSRRRPSVRVQTNTNTNTNIIPMV